MARDNAPVPHTCPMINEVIYFIDKIDWDTDNEDEMELSIESKQIIEVLEKIRKANDTLRIWGNGLHQDLIDLEDKLNREYIKLEDKISDLESEIEDLKSELEQTKELIENE